MTECIVKVEPFVVLMAIRYGLPRATYAHADAISLALKHAPVLRQWADTLTRDIRATEADTMWPCRDGFCRLNHDRAIEALTTEGQES